MAVVSYPSQKSTKMQSLDNKSNPQALKEAKNSTNPSSINPCNFHMKTWQVFDPDKVKLVSTLRLSSGKPWVLKD